MNKNTAIKAAVVGVAVWAALKYLDPYSSDATNSPLANVQFAKDHTTATSIAVASAGAFAGFMVAKMIVGGKKTAAA